MIIDDIGIHHGDWPLISINGDQDIKNSNWRDKNDMDGVRTCGGMLILGVFFCGNCQHVGIASSGIVHQLY